MMFSGLWKKSWSVQWSNMAVLSESPLGLLLSLWVKEQLKPLTWQNPFVLHIRVVVCVQPLTEVWSLGGATVLPHSLRGHSSGGGHLRPANVDAWCCPSAWGWAAARCQWSLSAYTVLPKMSNSVSLSSFYSSSLNSFFCLLSHPTKCCSDTWWCASMSGSWWWLTNAFKVEIKLASEGHG